MSPELKWNPWTGIIEPTGQPSPQIQTPPQMVADFADAEEKTKALLDEVHAKERKYLDAYSEVRKKIENAQTQEERLFWERRFDMGHDRTVRYRDEQVGNRDTAISNLWSTFAEKWPGTTCKLTTAAEKSSGKTYRTVEIESPYFGKRAIGPTKEPEPHHLVDESKGGFRALSRQREQSPQQSYAGGPPEGFGPPPSPSHPSTSGGYAFAGYHSYIGPTGVDPRCPCGRHHQ
jgi:hypothetical protein